MTHGSCICGAYSYTYDSEPAAVAICHCVPCRKTAGPRGSTNLIIPGDKFHAKPTGPVLNYTRPGDSGKGVTYNNCGTCGTVMWVGVEAMPDVRIVKMGTLDDNEALARLEPGVEVYTKDRVKWCEHFGGAAEKTAG